MSHKYEFCFCDIEAKNEEIRLLKGQIEGFKEIVMFYEKFIGRKIESLTLIIEEDS